MSKLREKRRVAIFGELIKSLAVFLAACKEQGLKVSEREAYEITEDYAHAASGLVDVVVASLDDDDSGDLENAVTATERADAILAFAKDGLRLAKKQRAERN